MWFVFVFDFQPLSMYPRCCCANNKFKIFPSLDGRFFPPISGKFLSPSLVQIPAQAHW